MHVAALHLDAINAPGVKFPLHDVLDLDAVELAQVLAPDEEAVERALREADLGGLETRSLRVAVFSENGHVFLSSEYGNNNNNNNNNN